MAVTLVVHTAVRIGKQPWLLCGSGDGSTILFNHERRREDPTKIVLIGIYEELQIKHLVDVNMCTTCFI